MKVLSQEKYFLVILTSLGIIQRRTMKNECRVVGDDRIYKSTSELARVYGFSHAAVINAIRSNGSLHGYKFELINLKKAHKWFDK